MSGPDSRPVFTLYWYPGSCSRVVMCALAEAGQSYQHVIIDLGDSVQSRQEYASVNPKRKVPALRVGDTILTETPAILHYLSESFPEAHLLPLSSDGLKRAGVFADLAFCSATLHPIVRGLGSPHRLTTGDIAPVQAKALELAELNFGIAEERLGAAEWWYGRWSILDAYVGWAFAMASENGLDAAPFAALRRHQARLDERPAWRAVLALEKKGRSALRQRI